MFKSRLPSPHSALDFRLWLFALAGILILGSCQRNIKPETPKGNFQGTMHRYQFDSEYVGSKTVDVWMPTSYSLIEKSAVLYLQDGQMLFDSSQTWNRQSWHADKIIERLIRADSIRPLIIVAIWNAGQRRHPEYMPQEVYESCSHAFRDSLEKNTQGRILFPVPAYSDRYLRFLTKELKPFIDQNYHVDSSPSATVIGGSSMGAMISLYGICSYPDIFGSAMCMSTHWPGIFTLDRNPIPMAMIQYLRKKWPLPGGNKIYFDRGTVGLDAMYYQTQREVDALMLAKNMTSPHFVSKVYEGADHTENDWSARFNTALTFLLPNHK